MNKKRIAIWVFIILIIPVFISFMSDPVRAMKSLMQPFDLQCEYMTDPLGIDVEIPRFSWKLSNPGHIRGQKQTGYQIMVASSRALLDQDRSDIWNSGRVDSSQSILVPFAGGKLLSNQECYWKVRIYDKDKKLSEWSSVARFSMGLLHPEDWTGTWIHHRSASWEKHIWYRKNLNLTSNVSQAFIHVASVGYHELYVNGKKVDDRVLAPALTRLDKRVLYVTYDISKELTKGKNTISIWNGPGWSRYVFFKTTSALRVGFNARTDDGHVVTMVSDTSWRCEVSSSENSGEIRYNDNGGEVIDARRQNPNWNRADFDDSKWEHPVEVKINAVLSAHMVEPTRIIDTIRAKTITGDGPFRIDMGRNFTGWLKIEMNGLSFGDTVIIKVADDDKTIQDYGQRSKYISNGEARGTFCHRFNYVAGRYVTIEGLKNKPLLSDVTGYALSTDLKRTGNFSCSSKLLNDIYETDLWTYRANTTEGFTSDCPHRERLGYGEEGFATAWGICLPNYRSGAYLMKRARDWTDVQETNGWIHHTSPQINEHFGGPMWSSEGLNTGWEFYQTFGDRRMLEVIYPTARRWLEFLESNVSDGLLQPYIKHRGKFLGDWAAPQQRREWGDSPEALFFNNCVYAMNLETFVEIAKILNKPDDIVIFGDRLKALKPLIHDHFFNKEKNIYSLGGQVQLAFPLLTSITPVELRKTIIASFDKEISEVHPYLDMGSSGLPVLLKYLIEQSENSEVVFQHLSKTTEPGYGYFLSRGETTWPEYWSVDVSSRIHTCYTGIASYFIKSLGGIRADPDHPGYKSFLIKPAVAGDLRFAEATIESPYGQIRSRWEVNGGIFSLKVSIPANSNATVYVPASADWELTESGKNIRKVKGVTPLRMEGKYAVLQVESGDYTFASSVSQLAKGQTSPDGDRNASKTHSDGPVSPYPYNPHYFIYKGKPVILLNSDQIYGALINRDFNYIRYLNFLKANGTNFVRIYPGTFIGEPAIASDKKSGPGSSIDYSVLGPAPGRQILPWKRTKIEGAHPNLGGFKFDLDTWDEEYFKRLTDFVKLADRNNVIVDICFFNGMYPEVWPWQPMYYTNNIQRIGNCPYNQHQTTLCPDILRRQEDYVKEITRRLNQFDNVIYDIADEPDVAWFPDAPEKEQVRLWIDRMLEAYYSVEKTLPNKTHLVAQTRSTGIPDYTDDARVTWLNAEGVQAHERLPDEYGHNKPFVQIESTEFPRNWIPDDSAGLIENSRINAWDFFLMGGAGFIQLNTLYTVNNPTAKGTVTGPVLKQFKVLMDFMNNLDFSRMVRFTDCSGPESAFLRAIAEPGKQYAFYLHHSKKSGINQGIKHYAVIKGNYNEKITLKNIPSGTYNTEWINPVDGSVFKKETLKHNGGELTLQVPAYSIDIAFRIFNIKSY
jgi:alpha-L-rhamnosidase